jgi:hypothetical protein
MLYPLSYEGGGWENSWDKTLYVLEISEQLAGQRGALALERAARGVRDAFR